MDAQSAQKIENEPAPHPVKDMILVVEDNRVQQMTYKGIFNYGRVLNRFTPIMVSTAMEGLTCLTSIQPPMKMPVLIILDWELPGMSGLELIQRLKADARWSGIPVIFATSHTGKGEVQQAKSAGAAGFLIKPIKVTALASLVEKVLGLAAAPP
jgi:two-component system chemotaxis response regulator CheY